MKKPHLFVAATIAAVSFSTCSFATVTQSVGEGSAVSTVNTSADFESLNALDDNPYVENGLQFSRTGLSFNNNGCGYAGETGCTGHAGFEGFSGNYMYGEGERGGFFEMSVEGGGLIYGLEFVAGTGSLDMSGVLFSWEAFKDGLSVGSGTFELSAPAVVGFSDIDGFDTLHYTNLYYDSYYGDYRASPAFDSVRADITSTPAPIAVTIDIKPSRKTENIINPNKDRHIKVAIVGDAAFDVLQVDPATVTFGPGGASPVRFKGQDYNHDGYSDLILTFSGSDTGIDCNYHSATLTGETYAGDLLEGSDVITVPPCN